MSAGSSPTKKNRLSCSCRTMRNVISSSRPSGSAGTQLRIRKKTNLKKNITAASHTLTSTMRLESPAGSQIAEEPTSSSDLPTKSILTPLAVCLLYTSDAADEEDSV